MYPGGEREKKVGKIAATIPSHKSCWYAIKLHALDENSSRPKRWHSRYGTQSDAVVVMFCSNVPSYNFRVYLPCGNLKIRLGKCILVPPFKNRYENVRSDALNVTS